MGLVAIVSGTKCDNQINLPASASHFAYCPDLGRSHLISPCAWVQAIDCGLPLAPFLALFSMLFAKFNFYGIELFGASKQFLTMS